MNKGLLRSLGLINKAYKCPPKIIKRNFSFRTRIFKTCNNLALKPNKCNIISSNNYCKKPDKEDEESKSNAKTIDAEDFVPETDEELQQLLKAIHADFKSEPTSENKTNGAKKEHESNAKNKNKTLSLSIKDKYEAFSEQDFEVVLSHEEQELRYAEKYWADTEYSIYQPKKSPKHYVNKRGVTGVFDLEDFVSILRREKVMDVAVIRIPPEKTYGDYMVIATGLSPRHLEATMELINKLYKARKDIKDPFVRIEGKDCKDWKVINMGNIVFHLFMKDTRATYDLESLWTLGPEHDPQCVYQPLEPDLESLEPHLQFLLQAMPN